MPYGAVSAPTAGGRTIHQSCHLTPGRIRTIAVELAGHLCRRAPSRVDNRANGQAPVTVGQELRWRSLIRRPCFSASVRTAGLMRGPDKSHKPAPEALVDRCSSQFNTLISALSDEMRCRGAPNQTFRNSSGWRDRYGRGKDCLDDRAKREVAFVIQSECVQRATLNDAYSV